MAHFTKEHVFHFAPWRADLVVEIDLADVFSSLESTCGLLEVYNTSSVPRSLHLHLQEICQFDFDSFDTYHDFLTGSHTRRPRFLVAALLTALATGVGGYIFGASHSASQTDTQLLANQEHFVQLFRENDHRAVLMQHEIYNLTTMVYDNLNSIKSAFIIMTILFMQAKQLAVVFQALETLILDRKLSPGLISANILYEKLLHLQEQAKLQGKTLVSTAELDVFKYDLSFVTFASNTVRIVVHVPVADAKMGSFSLFRYHDIPYQMNNDFFSISQDDAFFLAVSENHNFHFFLDSLSFDHCLHLHATIACPRVTGLSTPRAESCLWGIFSSNKEMILRTCNLKKLGSSSRYWELHNNQFIVFHGAIDTVFIHCNNKIVDSSHFSGLKMITLKSNCFAASNSYRLFSTSVVLREDTLLKLAPIKLTGHDLNFSSPHFETLLSDADRDVHIPTLLRPPPDNLPFISLLLSGLCVLLSVVFLLVFFIKWFKPRRDRRRRNTND